MFGRGSESSAFEKTFKLCEILNLCFWVRSVDEARIRRLGIGMGREATPNRGHLACSYISGQCHHGAPAGIFCSSHPDLQRRFTVG